MRGKLKKNIYFGAQGGYIPKGRVMEIVEHKDDTEFPYSMSFTGRTCMQHIGLKKREIEIIKEEINV